MTTLQKTDGVNHTIIVNWKENGFGCNRKCSYCNWSTSPFLPRGKQEVDPGFIKSCKKDFITISGGGEPLWGDLDNMHELVDQVHNQGKWVRVITREVNRIPHLPQVDMWSVSLDHEVVTKLDTLRTIRGKDIECSIVMPPVPFATLLKMDAFSRYREIQKQIGYPLAVRENLNSIHRMDWEMVPSIRNVKYVPREACISAKYYTDRTFEGHVMVPDIRRLYDVVSDLKNVVIFGGFLKHMIDPEIHTDYTDIDLLVSEYDTVDWLQYFGYQFVNRVGTYPKYSKWKSTMGYPPLHLVELKPIDFHKYLFSFQLDVDQIGYTESGYIGSLNSDLAFNIHRKVAKVTNSIRGIEMKHSHEAFQRYKAKLIKRGWIINE